jgi:signal transduction histidine kinase
MTSPPREHAHLLWVEASRDFSTLGPALEEARFRVVHVRTIAEALEVLTSLRIEIAVLDLSVPDAGGTGAIRLLRQHVPHLPMVVLADQEDGLVGILRAGVEEVVGRGAVSAVILRSLRHALDRARWSAQTRHLLRNLPDPAVIVGTDGAISFANGPAERMFGAHLARGTLPFDVTSGVRPIRLPPEAGGGQAEVRAVDVTWGAVQARCVLIRQAETTDSLDDRLGHLSRLASLGALCAGVTHESNNLLNVLLANLSVLQHHLRSKGPIADMRRELDEIVADSLETAKRMTSLLTDINEFSRVDQGSVEWVDVNEVVGAACRWIRQRLGPRAHLLTSLGALPAIAGDRMELRQVLLNLLSNALYAIEQRGGADQRITVETRADDGKLFVTVADNGAGISPDLQKRLFQPFFTTKPPGQGTGLGLALSGQIVKKHGGAIEVETSPAGSRFRVVLPESTPLEPRP